MRTLHREVSSLTKGCELIWALPVEFPVTASESIRALDDARAEYNKIRRIDRMSKATVALSVIAFVVAFYLHPLSIVPVLVFLAFGIAGWLYTTGTFSESGVAEARTHLRAMEYANELAISEMK